MQPETITVGPLVGFKVSNPGTQVAGTAFNVTITAIDAGGNTVTSYGGPAGGQSCIVFSGPDNSPNGQSPTYPPQSQASPAYTCPTGSVVTFTNGVGSASITLVNAESTALRATAGLVTGISSGFTVNAQANPTAFSVATPSAPVAGQAFTEQISAVDTYGNTTNYGTTGTNECLTFSGPSNAPNGQAPTYPAQGSCASNVSQVKFVDGVATPSITLVDAQTTTLTAKQGSLTGTTSSFTVQDAGLAKLTVANPGTQVAGTPFNVTITGDDAYSNPLSGPLPQPTFGGPGTAPNGALPVYPSSVTLTNGQATVSVTLYDAQSTTLQVVSNGVTGTSTSFTVQSAGLTTLTASSGANQTGTVNSTFASKLVATATDAYQNPVPGLSVTFQAPSSGASASFAATCVSNPNAHTCTQTTNASGQATSTTMTATGTYGAYTINATGGGLTASFAESNKSNQTISFSTTAPANAKVSGASYTPAATATSGLAVTITVDSSTSANCVISRRRGHLHRGRQLHARRQPGGQRQLERGGPGPADLRRGQGRQTPSRSPRRRRRSATVGGATYTPTATATSGDAVVITSGTTSVCTISRRRVSFVTVGTCTLDFNDAGNANYNAAAQVQQTFAVGKGTQTVSFTSTAPANATVGGATYTPAATATSGLAVTITVDSSASAICSISGGVVSFTAAGNCTLDANQAGNANWNAAAQVQQTFAVGKGTQTVSFTSTAPASATVSGATLHPDGHGHLGPGRDHHGRLVEPRQLRHLAAAWSPSLRPATARSTPTRRATPTGTRRPRSSRPSPWARAPRRSASPRRPRPTPRSAAPPTPRPPRPPRAWP